MEADLWSCQHYLTSALSDDFHLHQRSVLFVLKHDEPVVQQAAYCFTCAFRLKTFIVLMLRVTASEHIM